VCRNHKRSPRRVKPSEPPVRTSSPITRCKKLSQEPLQPDRSAQDSPKPQQKQGNSTSSSYQSQQGVLAGSFRSSFASRFVHDSTYKERPSAKVGKLEKQRQNITPRSRKRQANVFAERLAFLVRRVLYCLFPLRLRMRPLAVWRILYRRKVLYPQKCWGLLQPVHSYYAASRGFDRSGPRGKFRLQK
jgi:hypothetical protein